jgi:hypothetical protein
MKYLINISKSGSHYTSCSEEEIQNLINKKIIGLDTEIWNEEWCEWRKIKDTNFDLTKSDYINLNNSPSSKTEKRERIALVVLISFIYIILIVLLIQVFPILSLFATIFGALFGKAARNYIEEGKWVLY